MTRALALVPLAALAVLATATPALAGPPGLAPVPLLADYWNDFIEHWTGVFQRQNGIVMGVLVVGAACLFIITRGKWRK
jgi:hypothetical protein